jgi:hypothetical protein
VNNLFRDLKVAARALVSQPGFSIVAILTVTLGIGSPSPYSLSSMEY